MVVTNRETRFPLLQSNGTRSIVHGLVGSCSVDGVLVHAVRDWGGTGVTSIFGVFVAASNTVVAATLTENSIKFRKDVAPGPANQRRPKVDLRA